MKLKNQIGAGQETAVYEYEGDAVKLFRAGYNKTSVFYEASVNAFVEQTGLPVPAVKGVREYDGRWAIRMELIDGVTVGREVNDDLKEMAKMQFRIHQLVSPIPINAYHIFQRHIELQPLVSESVRRKLYNLLDSFEIGVQLCHFNYHGGKIIKNADGLHLLDWIHAKGGNPDADVAKTYSFLYFIGEALAEAYLDAYAAESGRSPDGIKAWLPVIAAERLFESDEEQRPVLLKWAESAP